MNEAQDNNSAQNSSIVRLGRIADIIFALAMAQCFFTLGFPEELQQPTNSEVFRFLLAQVKPLTSYAIAFVIVGYYWLDHIKQFRYYKKSDDIHISLYLLYLMSMFLIPYSDTLVIYFPGNAIVKICFSVNTTLIGLLSFANWTYATHKHRLITPDLDSKTIILTRWIILIEPVFSLFTIAVAIIDQSWWEYVWFLLPIPYLLTEKIFRKNYVDKNEQDNNYFENKV
ncbi:MAG: TMEM175 family protein [Nostoc sp. DedQUE12b]|uniref:TMEM175 family protein n=1 Tax=Nostoc sp. DedQUE12b TaxID=3075398 RepID=UPI002AD51DFA|nr:TMEM175 family protein [Nostoc sp. DedQUE12b]MDZ8086368.1 TMEM175 family protein [Nostoc sp. DedQUE12b]